LNFILFKSEKLKEVFPEFYDGEAQFFEITELNGSSVGFLGIKPYGFKTCEIEIFIFQKYRNNIMKEMVLEVLNFPHKLQYENIMISTNKKSIISLFSQIKQIKYIGKSGEKYYYIKHELI
jgi:predicted acetyltransferase